MYKYQMPDMQTPIETIRSEIARDYSILERECALPEQLHFGAVLGAVHAGMRSGQEYPFILLQNEFVEHLSGQNMLPELFDKALGLFSSVWNYFPHKDLGMSPVEKIRQDGAASKTLEKEIAALGQGGEDALFESVFVSADKTLVEFSDIVTKELRKALKHIGGTERDVKALTAIYTDANGNEGEALAYLTAQLPAFSKKSGTKKTHADIERLLRPIFLCENHLVARMPNKHYTSRMFQNIIEQFTEYSERVFSEQSAAGNKMVALIPPHEQLRILVYMHAALDVTARRLGAHELLLEAAHYALDWNALIDMHDTVSSDPLYGAFLALASAHTISHTARARDSLGLTARALYQEVAVEFPEVSRETFLADVAARVHTLLRECDNPRLLCAQSEKVGDTELSRLATLAPELSLRSPISMDDLDEPSPF